jgi:phage terminase large subunit-like protein
MACKRTYTEDELIGRHCILGIDLSSTTDFTALVFAFMPIKEGEPWYIVPRFFYPEDNILEAEKRDNRPYTLWAKDGLIITTPGNIVDYDFIEQEILSLSQKFIIDEIMYDPWKAQEIVNHLSADFEMVKCPQRYNPMAVYSDTFEKKILAKELAHDGNPILRWMMACTEVKSDRQSNIMPMKPRRDASGKRIDGIVAAVMALGRGAVLASSSLREVIAEEVIG